MNGSKLKEIPNIEEGRKYFIGTRVKFTTLIFAALGLVACDTNSTDSTNTVFQEVDEFTESVDETSENLDELNNVLDELNKSIHKTSEDLNEI